MKAKKYPIAFARLTPDVEILVRQAGWRRNRKFSSKVNDAIRRAILSEMAVKS